MKARVTGDWLSELETLVGHFEARKSRARERSLVVDGSYWYFALLGLKLDADTISIEPLVRISRVVEPPGEIELAGACKNPAIFGAVARYSHSIEFELAVRRNPERDQDAFNLAWWIVSALRVRTLAEILVPAVSDRSWSTIAGVDDKSCHVQLLEDNPMSRKFQGDTIVRQADVDWIEENLLRFAGLLENPRFRLAVDSLCSHHQLVSVRMMGPMLWSGIESLFSVSAELRFRLSALIAATLRERGQQRIDLYHRVKQLYDFRSRLVHGSAESEEVIAAHITEVRALLSELLVIFTEAGKIHDDSTFESLLFG